MYPAVPMASGGVQPSGQPGQRHTGVVHGGIPRRPQRSPRRDWLLGGIVAGLAVLMMLLVANAFGDRAVDVATEPTPTPTSNVESSLVAFSQETPAPTPSPTPTPAPTPTPIPTPTSSPTPTPPPSPTARLTPTPSTSLTATPLPTAPPSTTPSTTPSTAPTTPTTPAYGLVIVEPVDGSTTTDHAIVIRGLTQPDATITRDVPMWFDEHTVADSAGRWSFIEPLNVGENTFTFRVGDDTATDVTITINYAPS
jgi:hypothetical protein